MKVLFLDIDGVCNSAAYARSLGKGGMLGIDQLAASVVRRIIQDTGCVVVLSSTWRESADLREQVRTEVCDFIDVTTSKGRFRGGQVNQWLAEHWNDVEQYAILDDDSDFYDYQHLFKTTWELGITDEIAQAVVDHLNS